MKHFFAYMRWLLTSLAWDSMLQTPKFTCNSISGSAGIEMVTEKEQMELSARDTPLCSSCQMLVLWIQNQLKEKETKDKVFNYVNQVSPSN